MAKTPGGPKTHFVDLPDVFETFADSIHDFNFDRGTLRITFTVTRWDEPKPPAPPTGRRYPICRLVLTADGAQDLHNKLASLANVLAKAQQEQQAPQKPKTIQ